MTRQHPVLRTTTLERMVFSLTLTALLLGTNPGAAADTLDSPDMFPDGDTTEKFVTLGTLTATDTDDPHNGISDAEFTVPGTVSWTFTWKVNVASWDIADPDDPDDGAASDFFGLSVAISGATAIVGAVWDDDNGDCSGAAYLFDATTGRQIVKLLPDDGAEYDEFGTSVAVSGPTAIVGA